EHRHQGREPGEEEQRCPGEQDAADEERLAPSDARSRAIGPRTHNWLHEGAGEGALLREQSDRPGRDLRVPLEVKAGGEVEERGAHGPAAWRGAARARRDGAVSRHADDGDAADAHGSLATAWHARRAERAYR